MTPFDGVVNLKERLVCPYQPFPELVKTELTEGEREKAMDEIYAFRAGTKYYWRYRGETRNFKPKK